jgi:hypothetical protein
VQKAHIHARASKITLLVKAENTGLLANVILLSPSVRPKIKISVA